MVAQQAGKDLVAAHELAAGVQVLLGQRIVKSAGVADLDSVQKQRHDDPRAGDPLTPMRQRVHDRLLQSEIAVDGACPYGRRRLCPILY